MAPRYAHNAPRLFAAVGIAVLALLMVLAAMEFWVLPVPTAAAQGVEIAAARRSLTMTLTATPTLAVVSDTITLTASVEGENGTPWLGVLITFTSADLGGGGFRPVTATITEDRHASSTLSSTLPGVKRILANAQNGVTATTVVTFSAPKPHHFAFGPISSPQTAGVGFTVVITAQDAGGHRVAVYDGTAALSDVSESLIPAVASFDFGLFSGLVTATTALTSNVIHAVDVSDANVSGESVAFDVLAAPPAHLSLAAAQDMLQPHMQTTLVATVTDRFGNPVRPVTVTFSVTPTSLGNLNPIAVKTSAGLATTTLTAGANDASGIVTASVAGVPPVGVGVVVRHSFLFLPLILRNYPPSWELGAGSQGMKVYHIAPCADDPSILYAGREQDVIKSVDAGATWAPSGPAGSAVRVYAPAVRSGSSCQTVYVATWGRGVLKSTDGGNTWTAVNSGLGLYVFLNFIVADPDGMLYVGTTNGVYRSDDDGEHWTQRGLSGIEVIYLALDPDDSNRIYAATFGGGIFKSEDGGQNWIPVNKGLTGGLQFWGLNIAPGSAGQTVIAASNDAGVFITTDGGDSWQRRWPDALEQEVFTVLALREGDGYIVIAGTNGAGVYSSSNMGNSWAHDSAGLGNLVANFLSASSTRLFVGTGDGAYWRALPR